MVEHPDTGKCDLDHGLAEWGRWNKRPREQQLEAALREVREVLEAVKQHDASSFWGADSAKNERASWRGVRRKAGKALTKINAMVGDT